MLRHILYLIVDQLNQYLAGLAVSGTPPLVVAGNIGLSTTLGGAETYMDEKVVLTLVNLAEESSLKNLPRQRNSEGDSWENPAVYFNLHLLFSANFNPTGSIETDPSGLNYYRGLQRLSHVVEYFQSKRLISLKTAPVADFLPDTAALDPPPPDLQDLELRLEMVSLSFEQTNYLWGSLGGKQLPFVLYKASVVPIRRRFLTGRGAAVTDIQGHFNSIEERP